MTVLFETIKLKNQIIQLRQKLMAAVKKNGYSHPETIKYNQELNQLIRKFQSIAVN